MAEKFEISSFEPGTVIPVADLTQLAVFEDAVAERIQPNMTELQQFAWTGRVALRNELRPRKFNGNFVDMTMTIMEEPVARLLDARERGWKISGSTVHTTSPKSLESTIGFAFHALAKSTGRAASGHIQAEIWYRQVPTAKSGQLNSVMHGGRSIGRIITAPTINTEAFTALVQESSEAAREAKIFNLSRADTRHLQNWTR